MNALGFGHKYLTHLSHLSTFTAVMSLGLHTESPAVLRQSAVEDSFSSGRHMGLRILNLYFGPCQLTNFRNVTLHKWVSPCVKCVLHLVLKFHDSVFVSSSCLKFFLDRVGGNINMNSGEEKGLINFEVETASVVNLRQWGQGPRGLNCSPCRFPCVCFPSSVGSSHAVVMTGSELDSASLVLVGKLLYISLRPSFLTYKIKIINSSYL